MEFTIRKAVPADALAISIVSAYTWKTAYSGLLPDEMLDSRIAKLPQSAERMRQNIVDQDNFIVAVVDNVIVGFCTFNSPNRDPQYADSGEIGALYCLKGYNGYGIGKALFLA
ncbi:MAG: GNAT family N-acetyltransferase, partial [Oscillospiraceae bacterium]|nr:GNAT family N-acetyltransferase [Oscillospiraceae bacterium]